MTSWGQGRWWDVSVVDSHEASLPVLVLLASGLSSQQRGKSGREERRKGTSSLRVVWGPGGLVSGDGVGDGKDMVVLDVLVLPPLDKSGRIPGVCYGDWGLNFSV